MLDLMASCFAWLKRKREPERAITLVIIGLDDAGKTTTIASIKGDPPDGITPTVGFANKVLTISRKQVTVYDLGGGAKFRDVWKKYYAEIYGVVFVVDSCNKSRIEECKTVLHGVVEHSRVAGKPVLVLANKQDKEGALNLEAVDSLLEMKQLAEKVNSQYSLMGCSALKGYGRKLDPKIKQGLKWLIEVIVKDMSKLAPRIDTDVAAQKEENEKEKQARMERIRKIREEREKREKEAGIEVEEESDDDVVASGKINPFQPIHKHLENVEKKQQKKKAVKPSSPEDDSNAAELQEENDEEIRETTPVKKKKKKKKKVKEYNASPEPEDVISAGGSQEEVMKKKKKKKKKKKAGDDTAVEELGTSNELLDVEEQITPKKKKNGKKPKKTRPSSDDTHEQTEDQLESENGYHQNGDIEIIRSDTNCNGVVHIATYKHFESSESNPQMNSRVTLLEGNEDIGSLNGCAKKKTKKKKKKSNRTAPAPEEPAENPLPTLPPPAWKTPPGSLNRLPSLAPLRNELGSLPPALGPLKPIFRREDAPRVAFSSGPNGDDNDVMT